MNQFKKALLIIFLLTFLYSGFASGAVYERRGIQISYDYQHIGDGFGNIKMVIVRGIIKNTTDQTASQIKANFKLLWKERPSIIKKLRFKNINPDSIQEFQFEIDLATRPDTLKSINVKLAKIKFSTKRKESPVSAHNVASKKLYSLVKLTEHGKMFTRILNHITSSNPFKLPYRDEFETTDEYETRVNFAENEHFNVLMDLLEREYGEIIGGKGAIVRFLPVNVGEDLIYLAENSIYFHIPIRFGPYNADAGQFQDVNLSPRTLAFSPRTIMPVAGIGLIHKGGMFFLRFPTVDVPRKEGKLWRKNEIDIVLEVNLKVGVIQDGPSIEAMCFVEKFELKNIKTNEVYRTWSWTRGTN